MPRIEMSITPSVLIWARESAGYKLEEAKKYFSKIEDWETGISAPTYAELKKLASRFSCCKAAFFLPEPPAVEPIKQSFRTLPDTEKNIIPTGMVKILKKAKFFQYSIQELMEFANKKNEYSLANIELTNANIIETAKQLRELLDVSIEEQASWKNSEEAIKNWRRKVEKCGIFIFKDAFKDDNYSGFCLYDENYPIIYINNSNHESRQIFTLFHEVAHLLLKTGGIDKTKQSYTKGLLPDHEEVICNRFAAEFLVPKEHFIENYHHKDINDETIIDLAHHYCVSRYVILRRYLDTGKTSKSFYASQSEEYEAQFQKEHGSTPVIPPPYFTQVNYHSESYLQLIFQNYYNNTITENKISEYIPGIKDIGKFEERYLKAAAT